MNKYVYVGYDPREQDAFDVAEFSILRHSSEDIAVVPLRLKDLKQFLWRPIEQRDGRMWCPISQAPMSTEFAISRFAVPLLRPGGWAVFVDCDILCRVDIAELFALADPQYAVQVVKHNYAPTGTVKMDGQVQTTYSRKNWSSVILYNCAHPSHRKLTMEVLNTWPGRDLHAFKWLSDDEIGALPEEWNYLVGHSHIDTEPNLVHYTLGTPNLPGYENCEYAEQWREYYRVLTTYASKRTQPSSN